MSTPCSPTKPSPGTSAEARVWRHLPAPLEALSSFFLDVSSLETRVLVCLSSLNKARRACSKVVRVRSLGDCVTRTKLDRPVAPPGHTAGGQCGAVCYVGYVCADFVSAACGMLRGRHGDCVWVWHTVRYMCDFVKTSQFL